MRYHLSLGELVAALPLVLDREPVDAVVAVSLNANGLPTCALTVPRAALLDEEDGAMVAATVADELAYERAQTAVLVSFAAEDLRDGCGALDVLRLEVEYLIPHVEALAVQRGGWFRPGCREPLCCPPEGRPLPDVPGWVPSILAAARRRADANARAAQAADDRLNVRAQAAASWDEALADGRVTDAATARGLAAALDDLCVRDWVVLTLLGADAAVAADALAGIDTGAVGEALDAALTGTVACDPIAAERSRAVIERVVRAARGRRRVAATHTLAAVLDWWEGNLPAARERCEKALSSEPGYRLAELVHLAASRGIGPGWLERTGHIAH